MDKTLTILGAVLILAVAGGISYWYLRKQGIDTSVSVRGAIATPTGEPSPASQAVRDLANGAVVLDVRTDQEWQEGHAAGATHFELARLQAGELPDIPKDQTIYVYCKSGGRAGQAKAILEQNGFTNVVNIGGLTDWEAAGGPLER